jgi:hypothetical protein
MSIEERLDRLERENRFLKRCGVVAVLCLACVGLMAAENETPKEISADVIKARLFKLEDGSGPRGQWSIDPKQGPMLQMEWNRIDNKAETRRRSILSSDILWYCSKTPSSDVDTWLSIESSAIQFYNHGTVKKWLKTYGEFSTSD